MVKANLRESEALYHMSYGRSTHVSRRLLLGVISILCIITPMTNWLIPIAHVKIKKGYTIRWDDGSCRGLC